MPTNRDQPVYVAGETPDGLLLTHDPDVPIRSTLVWFEGQPADSAVTVDAVIGSYGDVYDVLMYVEPELYDGPASLLDGTESEESESREPDALERMLLGLPAVGVDRTGPDELVVDVGRGVPPLTVRRSRVVRFEPCLGPTGGPAVRLHLADEARPPGIVIYVAPGEVAFPPDEERGRRELSSGSVAVHVSDLPPGVSYHEMVRDFGTVFDTGDFDRAHARVQLCASFWWGARRAGLDVDRLRIDLDEMLARLASM